ncbi:MAG TPA: DsbA family protein [Steroidobacteraceae bacterium]|jgi:protein-disulfide isomerase
MRKLRCGWLYGIAILALAIGASAAVAEDIGTVPKSAAVAILRNPGTPAAGATDADVTLVEYFDYNCPFCKKLSPALQGLLKADARVALVYKDWPILGDVSGYAARLALAAGRQGKYLLAHDKLMAATRLASNAQVDSLLRDAGLNMVQLKADAISHAAEINALLQRNDTEVRALGIRGTPGLLVGRHIINGVYDVAGLEQAVVIARREHQARSD